MPLALSPNDKFFLVLQSDQSLPADKQPKFFFKALTGHEQREIAVKFDELEKFRTDDKIGTADYIGKIFEIAAGLVIGWENMNGIEFAADRIDLVLQYREALELIYRVWGYSPVDLKNSVTQSPIASDASANREAAPAAPAPVKTP